MTQCSECGAAVDSSGDDCVLRFHQFLELEFTDAGYGMVHHLTVPTFMLQHPSRVSAQGWQAMRDLLRQFLVAGQRPIDIRKQHGKSVDNRNRNWSFSKGQPQELPTGFTWTKTILDTVLKVNQQKLCLG